MQTSSLPQLRATLEALRDDLPPRVVKLGMLATAEVVEEVASFLEANAGALGPIICDPVMVTTSGSILLDENARSIIVNRIFSRAALVTPNKHEAEVLVGYKLARPEDIERAARDLLALGKSRAVLVKGGHALGEEAEQGEEGEGTVAQDYLLDGESGQGMWISSPRCVRPDVCFARSIWLVDGWGATPQEDPPDPSSPLLHPQQPRQSQHARHGLHALFRHGRLFGTGSRAAGRGGDGQGVRQPGHPRGDAVGAQRPRACPADGVAEQPPGLSVVRALRASIAGHTSWRKEGKGAHSAIDTHTHTPPRVTSSAATGFGAGRPGPFPPCERRIGLYACVDSSDWVRRLFALGVKDVQLRIKDRPMAEIEAEVAVAADAARAMGGRLWVNDYWALAVKHGAYGLHVGQEDLDTLWQSQEGGATSPLDAVREAGVRLGISTHSFEELGRAVALRPSYISLGPIYPTASKQVRFGPQGPQRIAQWRALVEVDTPLVAIGGIGLETAPACVAAGADGVCVISAVTKAADVEKAVREWQALFPPE